MTAKQFPELRWKKPNLIEVLLKLFISEVDTELLKTNWRDDLLAKG